jgi:AbrB family looped-hinge helix DNA binding protein
MAIQAIRVRRKGQVTLPADIRNDLGIAEGDRLLVERRGNEIVLTSPDDYVDPLAGVFQQYAKVWNPDVNEEKALIRKGMAEEAERRDRRSQ